MGRKATNQADSARQRILQGREMAGELLAYKRWPRVCDGSGRVGLPPKAHLMLRKCRRVVPGYGPVLPDLSP